MVDFWEVLKRCSVGEVLDERDYDRLLWKNISVLVDKYDIKYDPESIVPTDNDLADRAFAAAKELFLNLGFYCLDTRRRVCFSREELEDRLEAAPDSYTWGEGKDRAVTLARGVEDHRDPSFVASGLGVPVPQHLFGKVCQAIASVPLADAFCGVSLESTFQGIPIMSGHPIEVAAAIFDVKERRKAARLAGRPGLGLYAMISCAESTAAIVAAANEQFGALKGDVTQNGVIAELKVDFERMKKVPWQHGTGAGIAGLYGPLMGGYAGGPEGTMITLIAHFFLGLFAFDADYHIPFPIHIHHACNTTSSMLWLVSLSSQAIARNSHLLNESVAMAAAGPYTEMLFREFSAHAIAATVSGGNLVAGGIARDRHPERVSTLEIQTASEVGHIVARMGMTRKEANGLVKKLISRYAKQIPEAPLGYKFSEIYDIETVKPIPEYQIMYENMRGELSAMGLDYTLL